MFLNGQGKRVLVNTVVSVLSGSTFPTSVDFGVHLVSEFAGIIGMIKVDSSQNNVAQLRLGYQSDSGTTLITSEIAVASGGIVVNELNPAAYANVSIRQINSATPVRVFLTGLPIR
jgi:hypothetical protein